MTKPGKVVCYVLGSLVALSVVVVTATFVVEVAIEVLQALMIISTQKP